MNSTRDLLKRPRQPEGAGVGALAGVVIFALLCILLGVAAADWFTGRTPFSVMVPPELCK
ncbi:MAG: hypothetical protein IPJ61_18510 [Tessaracoccus sp.]|uniref:hypothetical protein n=1 Tax=Tessaracoccus sp. TaxID=1971211 RepID=UPI001ECCFFDF|nr:hypothetical protein [Tessaracoccus sp.]MBK7822978.1 hypothetical protein [Tessaracoccus sp.]